MQVAFIGWFEMCDREDRKMGNALTAKQEGFCNLVAASGCSITDAYRSAYNTSKMKPASVHRNAKQLRDNTKITSRIQELRAPTIQKTNITLEHLIEELRQAIELAKLNKQPAAIVVAVREMGRLLDLYPAKKSAHVTTFDLVSRIRRGREILTNVIEIQP
jgi:phage terminase small subunit